MTTKTDNPIFAMPFEFEYTCLHFGPLLDLFWRKYMCYDPSFRVTVRFKCIGLFFEKFLLKCQEVLTFYEYAESFYYYQTAVVDR